MRLKEVFPSDLMGHLICVLIQEAEKQLQIFSTTQKRKISWEYLKNIEKNLTVEK
jgi:hypothetical protein